MRIPTMAPSDPKRTPDPQPTGDLEHLFRQKFAEAEVTPRASLWEQLDHELLVQQNETYRRRLSGYRWAAAASLLLLVGGGTWFGLHPENSGVGTQSAVMASTRSGVESVRTEAANESVSEFGDTASQLAARTGAETGTLATIDGHNASQNTAAYNTAVARSAGNADLPRNKERISDGLALSRSGSRPVAGDAAYTLGLNGGQAGRSALSIARPQGGYSTGTISVNAAAISTTTGIGATAGRPASLASGSIGFSSLQVLPSVQPSTVLLAAQPVSEPNKPAAEKEEKNEPETTKRRRWKFNAAYAAVAFNPNANFSRNAPQSAGVSFADASSLRSSADAYETAAAEYRQYLQAGRGQRVAITADYVLNKHWSLVSGLAVAQQEAMSATSWDFLDGKSAAASHFELMLPRTPNINLAVRPEMPLRNVSYRYRMASVPVSARYTSNEKKGWAVYAKLGAAVNVLLGSRTELNGVPEATRVYNLTSADSPYRKVQTSVRGGAGIRFRPANAAWSLAVGPDLEAGLTTFNVNPSQRLLRQSRPYAVGLEASVQFGGKSASVVH